MKTFLRHLVIAVGILTSAPGLGAWAQAGQGNTGQTNFWPFTSGWGGTGSVDPSATPQPRFDDAGLQIKRASGAAYALEDGFLGHVLLHSGAFVYQETELEVTGQHIPTAGPLAGEGELEDLLATDSAFEFVRTYRTDWDFDGPLGKGWGFQLDQKIVAAQSTYTFYDGTGGTASLDRDPSTGDGTPSPGTFYTIRRLSPTALELRERFGVTRTFVDLLGTGVTYSLGSMKDRNGQGLTLSYGPDRRLTQATDSFGRNYSFEWYSTGRLERVVDCIGRIVQFRYNSGNKLIQVRTHTPASGTTEDDPETIPPVVTKYVYAGPEARMTRIVCPLDFEQGDTPVLRLTYDASNSPRVEKAHVEGSFIQFSYGIAVQGIRAVVVTDRNGNQQRLDIADGETVFRAVTRYRNRNIDPGAGDVVTTYATNPWGAVQREQVQGASHSIDRIFDDENLDPMAVGNMLEQARRATYGSEVSIWRYEYNALNELTSKTEPRAFPGGQAPVLPDGHLDLSDPLVQQFTTSYAYDTRGNLVQSTSPPILTHGAGFPAASTAPIVTDIVRHNATGAPLHITRNQDGNATLIYDLYYWPLSDHSGANPSSVPTNDPDAPIGYLARIEITGQGAWVPGNVAGAPVTSAEFRWDGIGNPVSITDGLGQVGRLRFNLLGQQVQMKAPDPLSFEVDFAYDANANLVRITRENLDEGGQPSPNGSVVEEFVYDRLSRLTAHLKHASVGEAAEERYVYDPNGNEIVVASPEAVAGADTANILTFVYDELDQVYSRTEGGSTSQFKSLASGWGIDLSAYRDSVEVTTTYSSFDDQNRLVSEIDGRGASVTYTYHDLGWVASVTDRVGTVFSTDQFDEVGNPLAKSVQDASNVKLRAETSVYDEVNRLVQRSREFFELSSSGDSLPLESGVSTRQWLYDANGWVLQYRDPRGVALDKVHSFSGDLLWKRDALGNLEYRSYDVNNDLTSVVREEVDPYGGPPSVFTESFEYDALRRLSQRTDDSTQVTTWQWDSLSNMVRKQDGCGNVRRSGYDNMQRRISETVHPAPGAPGTVTPVVVERVEWTKNSQPSRYIDDNDHATRFDYDSVGRLATTTYNDDQTVSYGYDANGNRTSVAEPNGTVRQSVYDAEDRRVWRMAVALGAGVSAEGREEIWARDGLGRITQATNGDGVLPLSETSFRYDSMGHLLEQDVGLFGGALDLGTTRREHDEAGNPKLMSYPGHSGQDVLYRFDASANRLLGVDLGSLGNELVGFDYAGLRRPAARYFHPVGAEYRTTYGYDDDARLNRLATESLGAPASTLEDLSFDYDASDRKRYRLDEGEAQGDSYAYDGLDRLVSATAGVDASEIGLPSPSTGTPTVWTLDGASNRLSEDVAGQTKTYTLDAGGRNHYVQTTEGGATTDLSWDFNGNLTSAGTFSFVYDFRNRLVEVVDLASGQPLASYRYDPFNRRIAKTVGGGATYHYWFGNRLIEDRDVTGVTTWRHVFGMQHVNDVLVSEKQGGGDREFYVQDERFSVSVVLSHLNGNAGLKRRYWYAAFGRTTATDAAGETMTLPTDRTLFAFNGHILDPETGLYYMRNRPYSPDLGRFIVQDPMGYVDGLNLYAFGDHDPVNRYDPMGHWWGGFATAVLGVVAVTAGLIGAAPVAVVTGTVGIALGVGGLIYDSVQRKKQAKRRAQRQQARKTKREKREEERKKKAEERKRKKEEQRKKREEEKKKREEERKKREEERKKKKEEEKKKKEGGEDETPGGESETSPGEGEGGEPEDGSSPGEENPEEPENGNQGESEEGGGPGGEPGGGTGQGTGTGTGENGGQVGWSRRRWASHEGLAA